MFSKILIPVDLTDKNASAISAAETLLADGGSVTVIHVIETLDAPFDELQEFYDRLETSARKKMEQLAQPLRTAGITTELELQYGRRAAGVVRFAAETGIDLIVLTSHQMTAENVQRNMLTISHQVSILAPCSVLILRS